MSQLFQLDEVDSIDVDMFQHMIEQCSSQSTGSRLWGLTRVSSRSSPNYGSGTFSYSSSDGSGVRVYIHDTSIRLTHQDFGGRAVFGANFVGGSNADNHGHGTHCAGTATGNEFGVAKAATVVAVKVLGDSGSGATSGIIDGLNWMVGDVQSRGVRGVGSMSLGGGANTALDSAVNSADAANIPVAVSAGNSNADACNQSPARASGAITVAASDINDVLSSFSNYGSCVDIIAPGTSILSASNLSDTGSTTKSGTSMSCPHVAGVIANYLAKNPNASTSQVKSYLDSSTTKNAIDLRGTGSATPNYLMYSSCA
jgi:subtilisin family serine protease